MKLSKFGRIAMASVVSLGLGFGVAACAPSNTIDFLYVTASKQNPGQVSVYKVDSEAGVLYQITDSPYGSGGRNPVADVSSANGKNLYVVNHDDNTIVEFAIGTDGKLYPQQTCNLPGSFPMQLAINQAGTYLYVVETYQPTFSTGIPGPGALVVFPVNANGQLGATSSLCQTVPNGTSAFFPLGNNPVAVNVLASGNFVYAVNGTDHTISAFQVGSGGVLSSIGLFPAGVAPNAIASDPTGKFLYVTDGAANQMYGFQVQSNGSLVMMPTPFRTDNLPDAVAVDPRGIYVYVANYNGNDVNAYTIDPSTGNATPIPGSTTYAVGSGPLCILIEPSEGRYVYTANFLSNSVSGLAVNVATGGLSAVQNTPFGAAQQPTCSAAITHGKHTVAAP
ncbi:MAG: beta-propeller fold lactonase family protein [Acidobacteriaceae bacterium]